MEEWENSELEQNAAAEPEEQPEQAEATPKKGKKYLVWLLELVLPLLLVLFLNTVVFRLVIVDGNSMYPSLHDRDFLVVRRIAYTPKQGDVVVIQTDPEVRLGGRQLIKRVIAVAGQTVFVDYGNNTVTVDGRILNETYINLEEEDPMDGAMYENTAYVVPEGHIFVLGDNRNHSEDSRSEELGMVSEEAVVGGVWLHLSTGQWFQ